ncbi:MAG: thioesterase family protein [Cyanobacteria bacterium P01_D01_bin.123]
MSETISVSVTSLARMRVRDVSIPRDRLLVQRAFPMSFKYARPIFLKDTDAAGVVYFANVLTMCHEAYEASLNATGVDLQSLLKPEAIALPITRANVDFRHPMYCGEVYIVALVPQVTSESSFSISYTLHRSDRPDTISSRAVTEHVAIHANRQRCTLPDSIRAWLDNLRTT